MALLLAILPGRQALSAGANQSMNYVASVTNAGATSVTLVSLATTAEANTAVTVGQPHYLTPNVPVGVGNPTVLPGATLFFPFDVTFQTPYFPGPSPQAAGGSAGVGVAAVPQDSVFAITLQSLSSDSTVASFTQPTPVLSAIEPYPVALGGALDLQSSPNLINFLTQFKL